MCLPVNQSPSSKPSIATLHVSALQYTDFVDIRFAASSEGADLAHIAWHGLPERGFSCIMP